MLVDNGLFYERRPDPGLTHDQQSAAIQEFYNLNYWPDEVTVKLEINSLRRKIAAKQLDDFSEKLAARLKLI